MQLSPPVTFTKKCTHIIMIYLFSYTMDAARAQMDNSSAQYMIHIYIYIYTHAYTIRWPPLSIQRSQARDRNFIGQQYIYIYIYIIYTYSRSFPDSYMFMNARSHFEHLDIFCRWLGIHQTLLQKPSCDLTLFIFCLGKAHKMKLKVHVCMEQLTI